MVNVFAKHPALMLLNTPNKYVLRVPVGDFLPYFWLAAGAESQPDIATARQFQQLLQIRLVNVPLVIVPGGGHQGSVWRAALGPMFAWMTPQLAANAAKADRVAAEAAAAAKRKAAAKSHPAHRPVPVRKP